MPDVKIRDLTMEYSSGGYAVRPFDGYDLTLENGALGVVHQPRQGHAHRVMVE